ncbi:MAG: ABC transporter ATP-binding protein [Reyranella sp.]|uniref:ABC transporter ATP-binding protein n=1 Tax=Reyranella sp. TaxID=1929291 RepID=UPI00272F6AE6|nr:ABC transporter ATP-binding protein [Reyranella sp.]MDP1960616.1 ABC transporter ATP-binding protein [Reyranella sp.]MDP2375562.1 ABC transporter ATP-binding protein [Reyranella sp.]
MRLVGVRGVSKVFANGVKALDGASLDVGQGEFLSVLGPSGCGKSTLLRLIAGLTPPSAGTIEWPEGRPDLGFVFQEPTLMPWATALANVELPLKLRGVGRVEREARAAEALGHVGLAGFERSYPRELSGGMKMRVSIARALVTGPKLLLMDEPFAALDEITRRRLNTDLLDLWQRTHFTAVFVTHSVFESVFLSQRIAVMSARPGRVLSDLAIPAPYPRTEAFGTSADYVALCRLVSAHLSEAMAPLDSSPAERGRWPKAGGGREQAHEIHDPLRPLRGHLPRDDAGEEKRS